ncbi:hypothetical protein [Mycobacterium sp.]|uniref:hypothetical protein n=1 Tax=Mycobacterium sp. TaxID=1785 RepID=UPI0025EC1E04|nr:hypothetical protein [Mycobacterium sp.]
MTTIPRALAVCAVLAGAAVGLSGVASAALTPGSYTWQATSVHDMPPKAWTVTSCGSGCMRLSENDGASPDLDVHLHGNTWTGGVITIDNDSLTGTRAWTSSSIELPPLQFQLTKVG